MTAGDLRARIRARQHTVQALYQYSMTGKDIADVLAEFESDKKMAMTDADYFRALLTGAVRYGDQLDEQLRPLIDRPVAELDAIERAILHIGCYELIHQPDVPWRVAVNESVELAKRFGAEASHKYINGVLDKVARQVRTAEVDAGASAAVE